MTEHNLFYYPYASFTDAQLPLLAALYFDKMVIIDPVGTCWTTIDADFHAREAVKMLEDAGILQMVTPMDVLAEYAAPITNAICHDMHDRGFRDMCKAHGGGRLTVSLVKVPQDLQTDQTT